MSGTSSPGFSLLLNSVYPKFEVTKIKAPIAFLGGPQLMTLRKSLSGRQFISILSNFSAQLLRTGCAAASSC